MSRIPGWITHLDRFISETFAVDFLLLTFMVKCLLISLYCLAIFGVLWLIKRIAKDRLSVRANYYSWYLLLLSFPLSRLAINDGFKLFFYDIFLGSASFDITPESVEMMMLITDILFSLRPFLFIATLLWLMVVAIKCVRQVVTNIRLHRDINRQAQFHDKDGLKQKAAAAIGLRADRIKIVAAAFVHSPVSYGVFRKTVLLPADYNERYSTKELYLLLLHEMGHIKNHDTIKLQLIDILQCFIWPLRFMKKYFVRDSEILCDNRVLGVVVENRDAYGELMLRECSTKHVVRGLAFSDSFHTLKSRIEAIYSHAPEPHRIALLSVIVALTLCASAVYAAGHPASWLKETREDGIINYDESRFEVSILYLDPETGGGIYGTPGYMAPSPSSGEVVEESSTEVEQNGETLAMQSTYQYSDGELIVDKLALYQCIAPYIEDGYDIIDVTFKTLQPRYVDTSRKSLFSESAGAGSLGYRLYSLPISELEQATEDNRYASFSCEETWEEQMYLFVAHWL